MLLAALVAADRAPRRPRAAERSLRVPEDSGGRAARPLPRRASRRRLPRGRRAPARDRSGDGRRRRPARRATASPAGEEVVVDATRHERSATPAGQEPPARAAHRLRGRAPARRRQARRARRPSGCRARARNARPGACCTAASREASRSGRASSTASTATPRDSSSSRGRSRPTTASGRSCGAAALEREYLALVRGRPRSRRGRIEAPIGRDRRDPTSRSLETDSPKDAVTEFEVVEFLPAARAAPCPARDRPHAPDPGAPRRDRPAGRRRPGLRSAGGGPRAPVPPRSPSRVPASHHRAPRRVDVAAARRSRGNARPGARVGSSYDVALPSHRPGGTTRAAVPALDAGSARARRSSAHQPKGEAIVAVVSMRELLEAGVHFGHQTRRWNPKMRRFIFTERGGIYIIDLQQTSQLLEEAHSSSRSLAERGGSILFVGTKKQAQDAVAGAGEAGRDAVRQPPLARRPADQLADDLRPDRAPARPPPAAR